MQGRAPAVQLWKKFKATT